ncbi:hypothetical protein ACFSSA_00215 [Luteolibacter algae]|uniref:Uncharacterized protein n=1 Tax=Luteolibacter algae TaxID=454151 RepID=A0ABW5D612_9BACT
MEPYQIFLLIVLPPFVMGILYGTSHLIARIGGWAELAQTYPCPEPALQKNFSAWNSVQISGFARYHSVVRIAATKAGLQLSMPIIFPGHKPIEIPWNEIHNIRGFNVLWKEWCRLDVGNPKFADLAIPTNVFEKFPVPIRERLNQQ